MVKKTMIPATKKLGKELIKEASPEHKLRACAYVRKSTDSEEQLESYDEQIGMCKRIIQEIREYMCVTNIKPNRQYFNCRLKHRKQAGKAI